MQQQPGMYPPQQQQFQQPGMYPPQQQFQQPGMYPPQQQQFQQPGMYPPQQMVINIQYPPGGMAQPAIKKKGWERLDRDKILIKQLFNFMEAATGCTQGNMFKAFPIGKDGEQRGHALFKAREESSFCERTCLAGDCRPFIMKIKLDDESEELDNENFLQLDRPCKCSFYCFNRPEVLVTYIQDGSNVYLGKVVNPWTLCNVQLDVFDDKGALKYIIEASCLQLGFHCKAPCEACQTIDFDIKSPSGEVVSTIQKKAPSCAAAMFADLENFTVIFPANATKEDKALLMAATLFADYRFFESKEAGKKGGAHINM